MTRKIDLLSGAWVEIREELRARDRFAVQEVASVELGGDGGKSRTSFLGMQNDMRNALLGRIITSWSYPVAIPAQNSFVAADTVIGDVMDLDDYAQLAREVEPLMDKISGRDTPDPKNQPSS